MIEAYKAQLEKMSDIQNEIRKLKTMSGLLDISSTNIRVLSSYFEEVIDNFDTWHFSQEGNDYTVWGYVGKVKYTAYPSQERLIKLLANHIGNFAKEKPAEADNSPKENFNSNAKTCQVEPSFLTILENVFGKVNA